MDYYGKYIHKLYNRGTYLTDKVPLDEKDIILNKL